MIRRWVEVAEPPSDRADVADHGPRPRGDGEAGESVAGPAAWPRAGTRAGTDRLDSVGGADVQELDAVFGEDGAWSMDHESRWG